MKSSRTGRHLLIPVVLGFCVLSLSQARAEEPAAVAAASPSATTAPDLATRVADLEAYFNNTAPKALTVAGPGHNA